MSISKRPQAGKAWNLATVKWIQKPETRLMMSNLRMGTGTDVYVKRVAEDRIVVAVPISNADWEIVVMTRSTARDLLAIHKKKAYSRNRMTLDTLLTDLNIEENVL